MPIRERYALGKIKGARVGRYNIGINTTFVIYRIDSALVDSGPPNQWRAVRAFINEEPVDTLLLSHHHEDHSGNAARIARKYRLTPYAPELGKKELALGYRIPILQRMVWGSPLPVETQPLPKMLHLADGTQLMTIHTPGHAHDLHCFYLPENGWLFSGDLYISKSIRYLRSDENLSLFIESLRKVLLLEFDVLFCPHRGIVENGKKALAEKLDNILELCGRAQQLRQQGCVVDEIVKKLLGPEDMVACLSNFEFSKANLISEALKVKQ
jgi:glyoxylase-like metal-dependent hydrolase (beta-lactamase superfamily II)